MKTKLIFLIVAYALALGNLGAAPKIKVTATGYDISDNLDLQAVASIFGDSDNLGEFERRLNDPENQISNLDLNEDGYIDYLRVIEIPNNGNFLITIQAVLGDDLYQDVATIELKKQSKKKYRVFVVGNPYIYGDYYVIEPVYYQSPVIFGFFYGPRYSPWHSPYYWGYYPTYFTYRNPYDVFWYRNHIHVHINTYNHYKYRNNYNYYHHYNNQYSRNDYGKQHPDKSFERRNEGFRNSRELSQNRRSSKPNAGEYRSVVPSKQTRENTYRRTAPAERGSSVGEQQNAPQRPSQGGTRSVTSDKTYRQPAQTKSESIESAPARKAEAPAERREQKVNDNEKPKVEIKSRGASVEKTVEKPQRSEVRRPESKPAQPKAEVKRSENKPQQPKAEVKKAEKKAETSTSKPSPKKESERRR